MLSKELPASVVRTVVPYLVGLVLSWPVTDWLGLTETQAQAVVSAVLAAAWYVLARVVEVYGQPLVGRLMLGGPSAPSYGRHEAGRPDDTGSVKAGFVWAVGLLLAALAVVCAVILVADGRAAAATHRDARNPHLTVVVNRVCVYPTPPYVNVAFAARRGRHWVSDDGTAALQVWDVSGRSNGGQWVTLPVFGDDGTPSSDDLVRSGGEGHLWFNAPAYTRHGGHAAYYRVLLHGSTSPRVPAHDDVYARCS